MEDDRSLEDDLLSFRQQWHEEITQKDESTNQRQPISDVEKASRLFRKGVENEAEGDLSAAVYYYRQAVRLVPDIEAKVEQEQLLEKVPPVEQQSEVKKSTPRHESDVTFGCMTLSNTCSTEHPQNGLHISALPKEVLVLIMRWVISKDLDVESLENMALACKRFYICSKEAELWKGICKRIWGKNIEKGYSGCTWRYMYSNRPHLRFDGLYISKNSYIRVGEQGINCYYKPFQLVEYYKYLRFFTNGSVLVYSSGEDPATTTQLLQHPLHHRTSSVYKGHYRLVGSNIVNVSYMWLTQSNERRRKQKCNYEKREHHFFIQLELKDWREKRNNQLVWENYSYQIKNRKSDKVTEDEIDIQSFRPYLFSRVRSYLSHSTSCL